ncbi:uncharacterized protein LOC131533845 [Onychostoma macrolepis]|uniref:uncharacterized protein LOC131533845 n=1 Tax=Onychostoma macrolepis TaxID=369639 RepID=UPI00272A6850|nr:uncharacterized protein LOC131533845 [Onychostoma macrolepis]
MYAVMRDFLSAQEQREQRYLLELKSLRESILQAVRPAERSSDVESLRMELPTPAQRRSTAYQRDRDSPTNMGSSSQPTLRTEPKLPVFQQGEDIENFLRRFERLARTWRWPEDEWSYRLVPLLTGQALEAYLAMDEDRAEIYADLKEALLEKFNISPETYRQRFRAGSIPAGESPTETYNRLRNLYRRWVKPERHTKEEIGETIVLEQLLRVLPYEIRVWVKEHEPTTGLDAAKLAQQYINAHRGSQRSQPTKGNFKSFPSGSDEPHVDSKIAHAQKVVPEKRLVCYYCQQPGHKATVCPVRKSKLTGFCYVPREEDIDMNNTCKTQYVQVTVNGQCLNALLDTGSSLSLLKRSHMSHVPFANLVDVQCVHGDVKQYPQTEVNVCVQDQTYLLNVAVVDDLPADMILGRDLPVLTELLHSTRNFVTTSGHADVACPVVTRAQVKTGLQPLPDLHHSLLQGGTKGPRKTRRQRRLDKGLGTPAPEIQIEGLEVHGWKVPENIAELQKADESLKPLFAKVFGEKPADMCGEKYVIINDVLYMQTPEFTRLVVPTCCRPIVLHLAHSIPWAGHMALQKTYTRISSRFVWPSMYTDVQTYCTTCPTCQKPVLCADRIGHLYYLFL